MNPQLSEADTVTKIYWSMEEAKEITGLNTSAIRFYDDELKLNIHRNKKGDRMLSKHIIDLLTSVARVHGFYSVEALRKIIFSGAMSQAVALYEQVRRHRLPVSAKNG